MPFRSWSTAGLTEMHHHQQQSCQPASSLSAYHLSMRESYQHLMYLALTIALVFCSVFDHQIMLKGFAFIGGIPEHIVKRAHLDVSAESASCATASLAHRCVCFRPLV